MRRALLVFAFLLVGAWPLSVATIACEGGEQDLDAGADLSCDALPTACTFDGESSVVSFTASECPNLAPVLSVACDGARSAYATCGSGGVYTRIDCTKPASLPHP
jgi:hypothetical protein